MYFIYVYLLLCYAVKMFFIASGMVHIKAPVPVHSMKACRGVEV